MKSNLKLNLRMLFTLPAAQVLLKRVGFMAAKISTCQMYQLFFRCISWDKRHHTPILFEVVLFFEIIPFSKYKRHYGSYALKEILDKNTLWIFSPPG